MLQRGLYEGGGNIPSDPNARRDQALASILGELKKTNKLLEAQGKIIEKMERAGRPLRFTNHPYLEKTDAADGTEDGSSGSGTGR